MPEQAPTLRDMINDALSGGTTYRELEARAVDPESNKRASRSIFNDIATGKLDRMPHVDHLRAIAAGLGVPYERVRQAAIRQWVPGDDERTQLIAEVNRVRAMADEVLAQLEGSGDDDERRGGAA